MADPMRIRASMTGDKVEVKVLMAHEMETGLRKDASGNAIPAHFIRNVTVTHGGRTVLSPTRVDRTRAEASSIIICTIARCTASDWSRCAVRYRKQTMPSCAGVTTSHTGEFLRRRSAARASR